MAFDPSGRLFYTEKTGAVRLFTNGQLQPEPVISFSVSAIVERGLLGITIDPAFSTNRYIYVYYTSTESGGCSGFAVENRVVRFTENNGAGAGPTTIFTACQTAGNHVGGNIHFGPDGKLYVSVGDNADPGNSQDLTSRNGKLHRLNPDGSPPTDNPVFTQTGALPTLYAIGLRNSFDFTFDPVVRGRIFASENGPGCDDETNRIEAGYNYGWRSGYPCDSFDPDPRFNTIAPLWYLPSSICCIAPTGIEVYRGSQIPQWQNHLFMANYSGGALYHFTLNAERTLASSITRVGDVQANMDILTGPDGAFYYMEGGGYQSGTLKRIVGQAQPPPPTASPTVRPATPGPAPTIPGSAARRFPETGKTVTGLFLEYWDRNGGLAQQGFPISDLMTETSDLNGRSYTVQYFERAVFEYHPENQPPYNVLLSQLGTFRYRQKYPGGAPNQRPNTQPGSQLFPETGKRVGGRFLEYWQQNGGLAQQGFPISEEFQERSDLNGQTYTVQYFERAVFEYHPENRPPFDVLLSHLGTFQYRQKYGPPQAYGPPKGYDGQ
jgi:glucose/arabinose dehydrogenase